MYQKFVSYVLYMSRMRVTPPNASQSQTVPLNLIFMNKFYLSEIPVSPLWYVTAQFMQVFVCRFRCLSFIEYNCDMTLVPFI